MLRRRGVAASDVAGAGRDVDYPSAKGRGRFRWFAIPQSVVPEAFVAYVQHLTPELIFDPALNTHPNGARELSSMTVCAQDPAAAAKTLADICGIAVDDEADGASVRLPLGAIRFLDAGGLARRYPGVTPPTMPWAAGFAVRSDDLDGTARYLESRGIAPTHTGDRLWIAPSCGEGVIIEFVAD